MASSWAAWSRNTFPSPAQRYSTATFPLDIARLLEAFAKRSTLARGVLRRATVDETNHRHRWLLRARRERPDGSRAAEQRDEVAAFPLTEMYPIPQGQGNGTQDSRLQEVSQRTASWPRARERIVGAMSASPIATEKRTAAQCPGADIPCCIFENQFGRTPLASSTSRQNFCCIRRKVPNSSDVPPMTVANAFVSNSERIFGSART